MSRIGWLERHLGFDRLAVWHRWAGFASVALLCGHAVCITLGYAAEGGQSIPTQVGDFVQHYPDVLMSIVGFALFVAVAATSVRAAPATALARGVVRGPSVRLPGGRAVVRAPARGGHATSPMIRCARIVVERALRRRRSAPSLAWRVGRPIVFNLRHRLRVHAVRPEADGIVSIYVAGRDLDRVAAAARAVLPVALPARNAAGRRPIRSPCPPPPTIGSCASP